MSMPRFSSSAAISRDATGLMDEQSMNTAVLGIASASLSSSSMTDFTCGLFGSMVMTKSTFFTVSAEEAQIFAPAAFISSFDAGLRSNTNSS